MLVSGGGKDRHSQAVHNLLEACSLTEKVQATSFDTTSMNGGRLNGARVILEK